MRLCSTSGGAAAGACPAAGGSADVTRRAFLAIGGLSLLSACGPPPAVGPKTEARSPSPSAVPTSASPSPTPLPRLPVQAAPEFKVNAAKIVPGHKVLALTLDDGPDPRWTPKVLKILREQQITATFFMIGSSAVQHPDLVRAVADEGHHIATHTWSHKNLRRLSPAGVRAEIEHGIDAVAKAGNLQPTLFRAPYGNWSPAAFAVCAELGQRSISWTVDPRDWDQPGVGHITSRVLAQTGPGSIVLNHDGGGDRSQTVSALRTYLPKLLAHGYQFVTL